LAEEIRFADITTATAPCPPSTERGCAAIGLFSSRREEPRSDRLMFVGGSEIEERFGGGAHA